MCVFYRAFALEVENLKRLQVTHVLNAAQCRGINSNPRMYLDSGLQFSAVMALDRTDCDISQFFNIAADFIESAVKVNGKFQIFVRSFFFIYCFTHFHF